MANKLSTSTPSTSSTKWCMICDVSLMTCKHYISLKTTNIPSRISLREQLEGMLGDVSHSSMSSEFICDKCVTKLKHVQKSLEISNKLKDRYQRTKEIHTDRTSVRPSSTISSSTSSEAGGVERRLAISPGTPSSKLDVNETSKICSIHFLPKEVKKTLTGRRLLVKETVPSVFFQGRQKAKKQAKNSKTVPTSTDNDWDSRDASSAGGFAPYPDHDYLNPTLNDAQNFYQEAVQRIQDLEAENSRMRPLTFGLSRFSEDAEMMEFYTGFESYELFQRIFQVLQPSFEVYRGDQWSSILRGMKNVKLPQMDQFFLFLCRCRAGLLEPDLAVRFGISIANVSSVIRSWTYYLHFMLASLPLWPSRNSIGAQMPAYLKYFHPGTRVILGTIKIKCQMPVHHPDIPVWNSGNSSSSFKGLVGVTPSGAVSFVSPLYADGISDQFLITHSGLYAKLQPNDRFLVVSKAMTVSELVCRGKKFPLNNVAQTGTCADIAKCDGHIQRIIGRVKQYRIFDELVPLSLADLINEIWTVCCLLTNFKEPLL